MSTSFLVYMGVGLWNSVGAAQEDQADAEREHGEREQHEDDFRLCLLGEFGADLGADGGADGDADGGNPDDVVEHEVADDAEGGGAGQHEVARGRRDVDGEAEQVDHQRYVDDATADAEDARNEADAEAGDDAERAVVLEVFRHIHGVGDGLMGGVPVHDDGHQQQEDAEVEVKHRRAELVDDPRAEHGAGERGDGERDGGAEEHTLLADVGKRAAHGVGHDDDERGARNLGRRVEVGVDAAVRQEQDEDRHADEAAADADERAECADTDAEQQEQEDIHVGKRPSFLVVK